MNIPNTAKLLYTLDRKLTLIGLAFEGKWWAWLLRKTGITDLHGLIMPAHNELKRLNNAYQLQFTYTPFYTKDMIHWLFEDPFHSCSICHGSIRMIPTLKNRLLKRLNIGKWKKANFILVG